MREALMVKRCECGEMPLMITNGFELIECVCARGCKKSVPVESPKRIPEHITLIGFLAARLAQYEPDSGTVKWALTWLEENTHAHNG